MWECDIFIYRFTDCKGTFVYGGRGRPNRIVFVNGIEYHYKKYSHTFKTQLCQWLRRVEFTTTVFNYSTSTLLETKKKVKVQSNTVITTSVYTTPRL